MSKSNDLWLEESPIWLVEGATPKYTITFPWASAVSGTPTVAVFKDGSSTDTAGTYMPSGSVATAGATLTWKALAALVPGKYVIVTTATVDGVLDIWKCMINVTKKEAMQ